MKSHLIFCLAVAVTRALEMPCSDVKAKFQGSCCGLVGEDLTTTSVEMIAEPDTCTRRFVKSDLGGEKLDLVVVGHASPIAGPRYAQSCMAVMAGDKTFLVDVGAGCAERVLADGYDLPRTNLAVLLTHFHSDHIADLGTLQLDYRIQDTQTKPLKVYGPPGVGDVVNGFRAAYAHDTRYRFAHHNKPDYTLIYNESAMEVVEFALPTPGQSLVIYQDSGLTITAFPVDHKPVEPALGYRFDYKGRSLTISGDTKYDASFIPVVSNTEVLVQDIADREVLATLAQGFKMQGYERGYHVLTDIGTFHASIDEVKAIADETGTKQLILTHLVPEAQQVTQSLLRNRVLGRLADVSAGKTFADEGMRVSLAVGTDAITITPGFTPWDPKCLTPPLPFDCLISQMTFTPPSECDAKADGTAAPLCGGTINPISVCGVFQKSIADVCDMPTSAIGATLTAIGATTGNTGLAQLGAGWNGLPATTPARAVCPKTCCGR